MKDVARLVLALTLIAAIAGAILSVVESSTREPIAKQRRLIMLKALAAVLPPYDNAPDQDLVELTYGKGKKGNDLMRTFYRGRKEGTLSGVAFKVVAPDGYSGNIEVMVGVDAGGIVQAIQILNHAETPGLGDKIAFPAFKDQFKGKGLEGVDWRVKKDGGQFDQISGATISPRAVVGAVRVGLEFFRDNRDAILNVEAQQ